MYLPRVQVLGIIVFFHVGVSGVDDGLGEVNHGVLLLPVADDLVLLRQAYCTRWPNRRILPSLHCSEGAVGSADETGECSRTWCGHRTEPRQSFTDSVSLVYITFNLVQP